MNLDTCSSFLAQFMPINSYTFVTISTVGGNAPSFKIADARRYNSSFFCFFLIRYSVKGGHWIVSKITADRSVELFNSMGWDSKVLGVVYSALKQLLNMTSLHVTANVHRVQCRNSVKCGMFCVYYVYQRHILHRSFKSILQTLHTGMNCYRNDRIIHQLERDLRKNRMHRWII